MKNISGNAVCSAVCYVYSAFVLSILLHCSGLARFRLGYYKKRNRLFNYLGAIVPLVWASMGMIHYIAVKPDPIEFPFIAIEIIMILCCCYLIRHKMSS